MERKSPIEITVDQGIGLVRLCRLEKRNALDAGMVQELGRICFDVEHRDDIHVVVLTGADGVFCAGGDINAWSEESATAFSRHWVRDGHDAFDRLARLRQPVIAVLNGHALGGGLELAACADYRVAEVHVKIGQPETGIGIIAGWSGTQRAVRRFGSQAIRRMALFGEVFTASEALQLGIVDKVVKTGEGLQAGFEQAGKLLSRGKVASEVTKMLVNASEGEEHERVLEAFAGRIAAASSELEEGVKAFKEKRPPLFADMDWKKTILR
ncbi:MAG: enoyl-CoA hydratase/isomerase family protein [Roseovarius sp.]|nr:enoyl-CoA hydratase/isomerase family protein [Roseovarius sp.]